MVTRNHRRCQGQSALVDKAAHRLARRRCRCQVAQHPTTVDDRARGDRVCAVNNTRYRVTIRLTTWQSAHRVSALRYLERIVWSTTLRCLALCVIKRRVTINRITLLSVIGPKAICLVKRSILLYRGIRGARVSLSYLGIHITFPSSNVKLAFILACWRPTFSTEVT